jgi:hypothetical protein
VTTTKHTCSTLKMNPFIECLLSENYVAVGGKEQWDEIYSEYIGLRENKSTSFILEMIKEITYLQTKVFIITKCIEVLAVTYSRDLVNELKQCGCRGRFVWSNQAQYSNDLKASASYAKKYISQLQKQEAELNDYYKKHAGDKVDRKHFDIWSVTLGKHQGYRINLNEVTVSEWCHMMNDYERWAEVVNSKNDPLWQKNG